MNFVFFMTAYNDIDSVSPVIFKLLKMQVAGKVFLVSHSSSLNLEQDYRIQYVRRFGDVVCLSGLDLENDYRRYRFEEKACSVLQGSRLKNTAVGSSLLRLIERKREREEFRFESLPLDPGERTVFFFDYNESPVTTKGMEFARSKKIPTVLMPHGLRTIDYRGLLQHRRESHVIPGLGNFRQADVLFANNRNFAATFPSVEWDRFRMVGSARYCEEWSEVLDRITPRIELPGADDDKRRVCIMLSQWQMDIWKEASLWIFRYLDEQEDFHVMVKPHPRGMDVQRDIQAYANLHVADNGVHSRQLVEWADVVIFWKSSIFIDAMLKNKPLLHMNYLSSYRLACADLVHGWNVNSREDFMEWVHRFREDRKTGTYTREERTACLDLYVDDADGDVLKRHVDAIVETAERAARW